jgi:nucleoside 2-deoxyribosyltransferase
MARLFISHAYRDDDALNRLGDAALPDAASPVIFPAIEVSASQRVSDDLMAAIRDCDGLVYLDTARSKTSFWVLFERNYALRLGKPVYAFNPRRRSFRRDRSAHVDPVVAVNWNNWIVRDAAIVRDVALHLDGLHKFDIRGDKMKLLDNEQRQMFDSIDGLAQKMRDGGVALLFLSNDAIASNMHDYVDPATYRRAIKDAESAPIGYTNERFGALQPDRCVYVWLDEPDPDRIEKVLNGANRDAWASFLRVVEYGYRQPKKLVIADGATINWNRVDDIMVEAFALAFDGAPGFRKALAGGITRFFWW